MSSNISIIIDQWILGIHIYSPLPLGQVFIPLSRTVVHVQCQKFRHAWLRVLETFWGMVPQEAEAMAPL